MKRTLAIAIAVTAIAVAAAGCDSGTTATTAAPAAAPAAPAAAPPAPPAPPPASAALPGLSVPYATEADFVTGCVNDGKIDKTVCECTGKAVTKEQGPKAYYQWAWEAYIKRTAGFRAKKWFTDNGMDSKAEQKLADAIGKCFVTAPAAPAKPN